MTGASAVPLPAPQHDPRRLLRRARRLEYLTVGWNAAEAVVAIAAAVAAGSAALLGFGIDSIVESSSGLVLLWRLRHDDERGERRERIALRLVGASLLLLAAYVTWDAVTGLVGGDRPDESAVGIALAIVSLIVMPLLARAKRRTALAMRSGALAADSTQTAICAWLSAVLLVGLGLNAWLGWWWADPIAALVIVAFVVREGVEALRGRSCCC